MKRTPSKGTRKQKRRATPGAIGPVPVEIPPYAREIRRVEDVEVPFKVDRNSPRHQKLARHVGWGRLIEIEREEREAFEEAKEL